MTIFEETKAHRFRFVHLYLCKRDQIHELNSNSYRITLFLKAMMHGCSQIRHSRKVEPTVDTISKRFFFKINKKFSSTIMNTGLCDMYKLYFSQ